MLVVPDVQSRYVDLVISIICSDWCLSMDAAMVQGGLEVNYQNRDDDEEAELEREELERQDEVSIVFQQITSDSVLSSVLVAIFEVNLVYPVMPLLHFVLTCASYCQIFPIWLDTIATNLADPIILNFLPFRLSNHLSLSFLIIKLTMNHFMATCNCQLFLMYTIH